MWRKLYKDIVKLFKVSDWDKILEVVRENI